jgi:nitroreductase
MTPITTAALVDALKWRYATKRFDPAKKIPDDVWAALEQSLVLTPSSFGIQPWKFLVVQDPDTREKLVAASWGQAQVADCSHFVVFALYENLDAQHVDRHIERTVEVQGVPKDALKGYRDAIVKSAQKAREEGRLDVWMSHQIYIALGQFMASAALLGVDTCPMEGLEPAKYDDILGLREQGYHTLCACAAGYRASSDKYAGLPKVRFKTADVVSYI